MSRWLLRLRIVLAAAALALAGPAGAAAERFDPFAEVDVTGRPGDAVPMSAAFTDTDGRRVTLGELAGGKPILLAPVYYNCPNVCMVALDNVIAALSSVKLVAGEDFVFVAYSIDPGEGPADARKAGESALRRYGGNGGEAGFHFLTGSAESVRRLSTAIGFRFAWDAEIAQYAHAAAVATVTPDGRLSRWIYGVAYAPVELRLALVEAGEGRTGSLADKLLLLCYRYDPETGRYSSLVHDAVVAGGASTVAATGGLIVFFLWRERRQRRRPDTVPEEDR